MYVRRSRTNYTIARLAKIHYYYSCWLTGCASVSGCAYVCVFEQHERERRKIAHTSRKKDRKALLNGIYIDIYRYVHVYSGI